MGVQYVRSEVVKCSGCQSFGLWGYVGFQGYKASGVIC